MRYRQYLSRAGHCKTGTAGALIDGAGLVARLPRFLRRPLEPAQALCLVRERLASREARFLAKLERSVFHHPHNPYGRLFRWAGCEVGDVRRLMALEGLEGTLHRLFREGIYLTVDEFKGKVPIRRGSAEIPAGPDRLRNPLSRFHVAARSGGSRGAGTPVLLDLDFIRACGAVFSVALEARGLRVPSKATWETPGSGSRFRLLKLASFGNAPARWFSQIDTAAADFPAFYRWSDRAMRAAGRLAGRPLPRATYVPFEDPGAIVRWMQEETTAGHSPCLTCFASSAVRVALAAGEAGITLRGVLFNMGGEPTTAERRALVERSGAVANARYGSMECGPVGYACHRPEAPDDVHLLNHLHAVTQPGAGGPAAGLPEDALLVSSLEESSPFVMINTSMGDQGVLEARACGCPLEAVGWHSHLCNIRSFEKLTAGAMTFLDSDIIEVLEEVMPARFGGSPIDYQLVEEEQADGASVLRLRIDPTAGTAPEDAMREVFIDEILARLTLPSMREKLTRESLDIRVERLPTLKTAAGKVQHLHVQPVGDRDQATQRRR